MSRREYLRGRSIVMSVDQYLFWAANMSALAIVIFAAVVLAGLAIWIWAVDIRGSGAEYH